MLSIEKYFEILNVSNYASFEEIRTAYKQELLKWHPDRFSNDSSESQIFSNTKTRLIIEAFNFIKANYQFKSSFEEATSEFVVNFESRYKVESSSLEWIEYYSKLLVLVIKFRSGDHYLYFNVPSHIYDSLLRAPSKGKYMHQNVSYKFKYKRLITYSDWIAFAKKYYEQNTSFLK